MRTRRRLARLLVPAMAFSMLGLGALPAAADHVQARSIESACADAPEDGLEDTGTEGGERETAIDCLAWYEVTEGVTDTEYRPAGDVLRGQMAAFLARVMRPSNTVFEEPAEDEDYFTDDDGGIFEDAIDFVAKHEVVDGFTETTYAPQRSVTRAQMAKFLIEVLTAIGAEIPEPSQDYFTDDDGGVFEGFINQIAELGIASGFTDTEYRPSLDVTRGQMARFLGRSLAELVDQELMLTPAEREVEVTLDSTSVERGSDVSGSITSGSAPQAATVDGCGLADEELSDDDPLSDGIQFSATVPADQELGDCTLAFAVDLANGQTIPVERTITVEDERDATLTLDQRTIAQGQDLTGQVVADEGADPIQSVEVSGCGLDGEALSDTDDEAEGVQFSVTIPNSAATGDCQLTFTVTYGAILPTGEDTFTETITVTQGAAVTTGAPELAGVSSPTFHDGGDCNSTTGSSDATHVQLGLTFDEAITGRSVPAASDGFSLRGYDAARTLATSARLSNASDRIAEACFPVDAWTTATTVTVARNTVGDAGDLGNPEQSLGVKSLTLAGATTPEIVAGESASATQYTFTFDEPLASATDDLFRLVTADGEVLASTAADVDGTEVTATFPDRSGETIVRIAALNGAVTSAVDGAANAVTVERLGAGASSAPDLASVTYDPDAIRQRNTDADTELETVPVDEVRYVFDVSVLEQGDNEARFELVNADGSRTQPAVNQGTGDPVVRSSEDGRVVIVEYPDRALETATIATVYANAVRAASGSQPANQLDALARTPQLTYASGTTLAPAATSATVTSSSNLVGTSFTVTVTFDEPVDEDSLGAGAISLYDDQGRRFTISATPTRDADDPTTITVTSSPQTGTSAEVGSNAVLVGLAPATVQDPQGNSSHAQVVLP